MAVSLNPEPNIRLIPSIIRENRDLISWLNLFLSILLLLGLPFQLLVMTIKGGTTPACAACKYQRRKCVNGCPLAPYFPANQPKRFNDVHRLFGVSNITKLLKKLHTKEMRDDAMTSAIFEADMRQRIPVYGCSAMINSLTYQINCALRDLQIVRAQIAQYKQTSTDQIEGGYMNEYNDIYADLAPLFPPDMGFGHHMMNTFIQGKPFPALDYGGGVPTDTDTHDEKPRTGFGHQMMNQFIQGKPFPSLDYGGGVPAHIENKSSASDTDAEKPRTGFGHQMMNHFIQGKPFPSLDYVGGVPAYIENKSSASDTDDEKPSSARPSEKEEDTKQELL